MDGSYLLKDQISKKIKTVFKTCLDRIELVFGTDFEEHEILRKQILRAGNDAIRDLHEQIDRAYKIEKLPVTVVKIEGMNKVRVKERNDG
jgi:hypothetical protein